MYPWATYCSYVKNIPDRQRDEISCTIIYRSPELVRVDIWYADINSPSMANQATKKAAKAKQTAANTYKPGLLVINAIYIFVYVLCRWEAYSSSWANIAGSVLLLGLTWYAYVGILEDSSAATKSDKYNDGSGSKDLAGGSSLDLLGLVVVIQLGTAFVSSAFYWLLVVLPVWYGYSGYKMLQGFMGGGASNQAESGEYEIDAATKERREKRAERRRQKWNS